MQKWEYKQVQTILFLHNEERVPYIDGVKIKREKMPKVSDYLQELDSQGWELVGYYNSSFTFKRPLEE